MYVILGVHILPIKCLSNHRQGPVIIMIFSPLIMCNVFNIDILYMLLKSILQLPSITSYFC